MHEVMVVLHHEHGRVETVPRAPVLVQLQVGPLVLAAARRRPPAAGGGGVHAAMAPPLASSPSPSCAFRSLARGGTHPRDVLGRTRGTRYSTEHSWDAGHAQRVARRVAAQDADLA